MGMWYSKDCVDDDEPPCAVAGGSTPAQLCTAAEPGRTLAGEVRVSVTRG
jgi:hypothetical protein